MKVFIHFEDSTDDGLHKTSKITLPKKWVGGPCSAVVKLFVDSYNKNFPTNTLGLAGVHLATADGHALANESTVSDFITAGADVYVKLGAPPAADAVVAPRVGVPAPAPAPTSPAAAAEALPPAAAGGRDDKQLLCMRFGCQKKYFEHENGEECCRYHRLPPVFHETAKFWACCSDKKCYDWETFMQVKGCMVGRHTTEKPQQQQFLGGCDVRSGNDGSEPAPKLKSIDEFNEERRQVGANGGGAAAGQAIAQMYQVRQALDKAGVPGEAFDRAKEAVSARLGGDHVAVAEEMRARLTDCLSAMEQS